MKELQAIIGEACTTQRISNPDGNINNVPSKTLVLLDDVDILLIDDKGFWQALSQILVTSKCPIIMTFTSTSVNNDRKSV